VAKYITATEAAKRLGVTDKTVRSWIKDGKLDAHHVASNRLAILESDVERIKRERKLYEGDVQSTADLQARVEELEQKNADLERRQAELESRLSQQTARGLIDTPASYGPVVGSQTQKKPSSRSVDVPADLPDGTLAAADFARLHSLPYDTIKHHIKRGIGGDMLEVTEIPHRSRPNYTEKFLTPEQQQKALDYWDRHRVRYQKPTGPDESGETSPEE